MSPVVVGTCQKRWHNIPLFPHLEIICQCAIVWQSSITARYSTAGTVKGLKESDDETLEDVFIRLIGRSIEDVETTPVMKESKTVESEAEVMDDWSKGRPRDWDEVVGDAIIHPMLHWGPVLMTKCSHEPLRGWNAFSATFRVMFQEEG